MKYLDSSVRAAALSLGLWLAVGMAAGCNTSTEPTVQLNFPEGMKIPEPAKGPVVNPGMGPTSQGDPHDLTKLK
jgi:hypothetical protein